MELKEVCETLLDNADMRIDYSAYPRVVIELYVYGTVNDKYWKVVFDCGQVVHMDAAFDDDSSANDLFLVIETSVSETTKGRVMPALQNRMACAGISDPVWEVHLFGDMSLSLVTTEFSWELFELSEEEHKALYA